MKIPSSPRKTMPALLGLVCLAVIIGLLGPRELSRFHMLLKTHNHSGAALAAMDTIMKMNTNRIFNVESGYANLPNVLGTMQPRTVEITPQSMRLELHSGIFPYGFRLLRTHDGWKYSWYLGWFSRVLHSIHNR